MVEPAGPFKIILSEPPQRASDDLGNPAAEQVQVELSRLLDLDEGMAASIAGAMPIVILHGLNARQAGVARERLQVIVQLGCKVITTDEPSDTLPHVNWPVLPPIAQLDESDESRPAARPADPAPAPAPAPGTLTCPSCNASFALSPLNGAGAHGHAPSAEQSPDRSETRGSNRRFQHEGTMSQRRPEESSGSDAGLQRETFGGSPAPAPPEEVEDDWMSPPVTKVPTPETSPEPVTVPDDEEDLVPGGTARFNEAALLAYRQADAAPPPAEQTLPPPPPPPQPLPVTFGDSEVDLGAASASHSGLTDFSPPPADASSFEATGSLHDSGSDILDLDPPHRGHELVDSGAESFSSRSSGDFEDDFDLLGDDPDSDEDRAPTLESLDELEESAPVHSGVSGSRGYESEPDPFPDDDPFSDDEFGRMLQSDEAPRGRQAAAAPAASASEGDLDAVLSLFGPEDEEPLDDMAGLQPAPLDLSAKGGPRRRNLMGSEFPSDILEPLNPSEAMEIIKSQKTRGAPRGARMSSDDDFDLFGESGSTAAAPRAGRKAKKKTRGVPFSASGEDLDLFDDNPRPSRSRSKSRARGGGGGGGGGADPFARARQAIDEERGSSPPTSSKKRREGRSSSRRSRDRDRGRSPAARGGGGGGGSTGPAPKGAGDHGLVLSRISDPDKKERAAELIAEIKGCSLDDASRLTERTIIPVLKGVSRDVAEFHLDKFRRYKIAGRVTTRQRS
jgi:hypothetical protein